MEKVIIFCFAGRKQYLDIQLKYIIRLLNTHSNIEYHLWNFSRNDDDNNYLRELPNQHDRIKIFNQFYEGNNTNTNCIKKVGVLCSCTKCRVGKWSEPYKYYDSNYEIYQNSLFIKMDDDVVFISINKINQYIECILQNPDKIISANLINNGVCAFYDENMKRRVIDSNLLTMNSSIEDFWFLCTNKTFFHLSHDYFIEMLEKEKERNPIVKIFEEKELLTPTRRCRFSINTIGFTYNVMKQISYLLRNEVSIGDEPIISHNFDIFICNPFLNVHFHFSDQRANIPDEEEKKYLTIYADQAKMS